jgi:hypothetical protein
MQLSHEQLLHPLETDKQFIASLPTLKVDTESSFPRCDLINSDHKIGSTVVRFVFWKHLPENDKSVIPLLENTDVLALEAAATTVFEGRSKRRDANRNMKNWMSIVSILVSGECDPGVRERLQADGVDVDEYLNMKPKQRKAALRDLTGVVKGYSNNILPACVDKVENIEKIDIDYEQAPHHHKLLTNYLEADKAINSGIREGKDLQALRVLIRNKAKAGAVYHKYRDGIMSKQVEGLINKYKGKTISVLVGAGHHNLTRLVTSPGVSMQKIFSPDLTKPVYYRTHKYDDMLDNTFRAGISNPQVEVKHIDMSIAGHIIYNLGGKNAVKITNEMTDEQYENLAKAVLELWEKPRESAQNDTTALERRKKEVIKLILNSPNRKLLKRRMPQAL